MYVAKTRYDKYILDFDRVVKMLAAYLQHLQDENNEEFEEIAGRNWLIRIHYFTPQR